METTTKTNNPVIVERRVVKAEYDFNCIQAIIDHPKYGLLFLTQGFGGIDTLGTGGAVRWQHGNAYSLQPTDTFAVLDSNYNDASSNYMAMCEGHDDSRPILEWDGLAVEKVAQLAGL